MELANTFLRVCLRKLMKVQRYLALQRIPHLSRTEDQGPAGVGQAEHEWPAT